MIFEHMHRIAESDGMRFATRAIHSGEEPDVLNGYGDVVSPIHLSSTFARADASTPTKGFDYSRTANPTRKALETKLASLEDAKHGLAFSSGLAAETAILLSLLENGDHVIAGEDLYGGTRRLLTSVMARFGVRTTFTDVTDAANVKKSLTGRTRLVWIESPSNPLLKVCDIHAISEIASEAGAATVVDNTFMSPYLQRPLALGAAMSLHSTTKYVAGHSDVIGGAVMLNDDALYERLKYSQNAAGSVPSPFDCFLIMRGAKTLELRMRRHCDSALDIASFLEGRREVRKVHYPGLRSHPQHGLAQRQGAGFGGMISFELTGGGEAARRMLKRLRLFAIAESLGGVESLIELPAIMTHASVPEPERKRLGIDDGLIRLSVGIEDVSDLKDDLNSALSGLDTQ